MAAGTRSPGPHKHKQTRQAPSRVIYLFESLFPRLIEAETRFIRAFSQQAICTPANRAREFLLRWRHPGEVGRSAPRSGRKKSTTALLPIRSLTCPTTEGELFEVPASPLIYSPKSTKIEDSFYSLCGPGVQRGDPRAPGSGIPGLSCLVLSCLLTSHTAIMSFPACCAAR